jgi:photosystem II stability/assembly factor-like uncharacterized protein
VYIFLDNRGPTTVKGRPYLGGEVYRSDDRGEHWRKANTQDLYDVFGVFGWKFADVHVDPRNPDHLYILGNHGFQSFDGGATWRRIGDRILRVHDTDGRALHLDQHELVIDPANPDRLLLGNDGGLFMSYDAGESWLHLNDIPVSQMYFVATDNATPYNIYAGTQDDAAVYGPSDAALDDAVPARWRSVYLDRWTGGDSFVTLPDPTDPHVVYYEHQNGDMLRMDVTGSSVLTDGPSTVNIAPRARRGEPRLRFSWYTPFLISRFDPHTLYVGGNRVLKSTDRGDHWVTISPDLGDPPGTDRGLVTTGAFTRLDESPLVRGMLAGGTEGGRVWLTQDDGQHWRRIDAGLPREWVTHVTLSRWDAGTLYASFTGFRQDDERPYVFVSQDTGRTWRSVAANLPLESVNAIKEDPADRDLLYLGTDRGVYISRNRGTTWESLSATLPSTSIMDLTVQERERELVIGTYGRGAWILDLDPIHDTTKVSAARPLYLYPIRDAVADWFPWDAVPGERRGRNVARMQVASLAAGDAAISVSDSTGHVVRTWHAAVVPGVNTVVWDLQMTNARGTLDDTAPGVYTVDFQLGASRADGRIRVLPDPTTGSTMSADSLTTASAVAVATQRMREHGQDGFSVTDLRRTRDWFTPQLYALLLRDMRDSVEIGYLDWDPFTGAQDEVGAFRLEGARQAGDTILVSFSYLQRRDTVTLAMRRVDSTWRIANFMYPGNPVCHRDLAIGLARYAREITRKQSPGSDPCHD